MVTVRPQINPDYGVAGVQAKISNTLCRTTTTTGAMSSGLNTLSRHSSAHGVNPTSGEVQWYGDDPIDRGMIVALVNQVEVIPDELEAFEHIELISRELDEFRKLLDRGVGEEELHQFLKNSERLLGLTSIADPISRVPARK